MIIDHEVIRGCINNDRLCQHILYKKLHGFMLGIAFKYTNDRDTAVDYMNAGFYKLLRKVHLYDFKTPFDVWARVLIKNTIIDEMRKEIKHKHLVKVETVYGMIGDSDMEYEYQKDITDIEENLAVKKLEMADLNKKLDILPSLTKRVVIMQIIEGFTHKQISKLLGITESLSKWHLVKGKNMLREEFYMSF